MQITRNRWLWETGKLSCEPGALSGTGGIVFLPNGTAEVRNILSSHMTGVECPNPSNFVFHNIFFSSDHSVGGFDVSGAVPFPVLPLHDGQLESALRLSWSNRETISDPIRKLFT